VRVAVSLVVDTKVGAHPRRNEVLFDVPLSETDVFFYRQLRWQGDFKFPGKLRIVVTLDFLNSVP
jgi:hypothetical protein